MMKHKAAIILFGKVTAVLLILFYSLGCERNLEEVASPAIKLTGNVPPTTEADGRASFRFVANISPLAGEEYATVTFRCTGGAFAGSDSATLQTVRANERGEAVSEWIVPQKGGEYFVSASVGTDGNRFEDRVKVVLKDTIPDSIPVVPPVVDIPDTIRIQITGTDTVRANGLSLLKINLALLNSTARQLTVSNNTGTLSDGTITSTTARPITVQLDSSRRGEAYLRIGNRVEPYFIRAFTTNDPNTFQLVSFTPKRAWPDRIFVEADSTYLQPNSQTPVNIFLTRNVGQVSVGTPIDIEAYQEIDGTKRSLPLLKNIANSFSDEQGRASFVFVADTNVAVRARPVTIRASSLNDRGEAFFREIQVQLKAR